MDKEYKILVVLYQLQAQHAEVSPTMVARALGYDGCSDIVHIRRKLVARGMVNYRGEKYKGATLSLTPAGMSAASTLPSMEMIIDPVKIVAGEQDTDSIFLSKDDMGIAKRKVYGQIVSDEYIEFLYAGRTYGTPRKRVA